jgi:hypothetical protein
LAKLKGKWIAETKERETILELQEKRVADFVAHMEQKNNGGITPADFAV